MGLRYEHLEVIEKHAAKLGVLIAVMVAIGGLAELTPIFVQAHSVKPAPGSDPTMRCASPAGTYVREACYQCHSQMIRTLRFRLSGTVRIPLSPTRSTTGRSSGAQGTGPDLARIGGKYSDEWHRLHLLPRPRDLARIEHAELPVAR